MKAPRNWKNGLDILEANAQTALKVKLSQALSDQLFASSKGRLGLLALARHEVEVGF